jgi:hypothetical protein
MHLGRILLIPAVVVLLSCPPSKPGGDICSNTIKDGSFENGTPNSYWSESSTNFSSPICNQTNCGLGGGTGPYQGTYWAWFGGAANEVGTLLQTLVIPVGANTLRFYLQIPAYDSNPGIYDVLTISIDGTPVFQTDNQDPNAGSASYYLKTVDVTAYADGAQHNLEIKGTTDSTDHTNFFIDGVELVCN